MRDFDGTGLLVNLNTDQVYELNETGFHIVELLDGQRTVDDLIHVLTEEYEADESSLRADVESLIDSLMTLGLAFSG